MFEVEDLMKKLANELPETVFPSSQLYDNTPAPDCQILFCSDGPLKGDSTILVNGKPFPVKRFDYSFTTKKGIVALEQYVTWMADTRGLVASFAKLGIDVVFVPSTSLRPDDVMS
jgi:hypothetical protein